MSWLLLAVAIAAYVVIVVGWAWVLRHDLAADDIEPVEEPE
jgi:hypothetical protein